MAGKLHTGVLEFQLQPYPNFLSGMYGQELREGK